MNWRRSAWALVFCALLPWSFARLSEVAHAAGCTPPLIPVEVETGIGADGVEGTVETQCVPDPNNPEPDKPDQEPATQEPATQEPARPDPFEYAFAYDCPGRSVTSLSTGTVAGEPCENAAMACQFQGAKGAQRLQVYRRSRGGSEPWVQVGTTCGPGDMPPGAPVPPPIPRLAQIQQAFLALPFAKPTVNIQPEGDVTLVNLPTYFEAQWPTANLGPGDISKPVQLLSWSIEFRIDPAEYTYIYDDGTTSAPTTDIGGPHPVGRIRHTYDKPHPAATVKVDARLTGSYRVNRGTNWIPLAGVADLRDEPVVTLQVREATARLYGN